MLDEAWTLSPSVALRPEPFGALAYHFGNRKLTFLKRPELVQVVQGLASQPDVRSALLAADVPAHQHDANDGAHQQYHRFDRLHARDEPSNFGGDDNEPSPLRRAIGKGGGPT